MERGRRVLPCPVLLYGRSPSYGVEIGQFSRVVLRDDARERQESVLPRTATQCRTAQPGKVERTAGGMPTP